MTLTQTQSAEETGAPQDLLIEEARQHHRRRLIHLGGAVLLILALAAGTYFGGVFRSSPAPGRQSPPHSDHRPALATHGTRPSFVLVPTWLPPRFSASGGGYVDPPGGLKFGSAVDGSVGTAATGATPAGQAKSIPVIFTLDYYGYHNPESKSIRLTGLRNGFSAQGTTTALGGRHASLASSFVPGYFGGNTTSSASWVERSVSFNVIAQGITKDQLARFVAGLKEQAPPRDVRIPAQRAGTSQVDACKSLHHSGFRCVTQFDAQVSAAPVGTTVGTRPASGTSAPRGSFVSLVVSSSGTLSRISSVLAMSPEEAKGELHKEGFVTEASCVVAPHETALGTVVSQTPSPGSPVENGYLVRLTLAQRSCPVASLK